MAVTRAQKCFANGVDLAVALKTFDPKYEAELHNSTTLADDRLKKMTPGLAEARVAAEGIWDRDETNLDKIGNALEAALGVETEGNFAWAASNTPHTIARFMRFIEASYSQPVEIGQLLMCSAELVGNSALLGVIASEDKTTAASATDNSLALDHTGASSAGLTWQGHVLAAAGTSTTITLQHSIDNSVWVDLDAIVVSGRGSFQREVAAGITINRYTRIRIQPTVNAARTFVVQRRPN